jgi:hypothetical protein
MQSACQRNVHGGQAGSYITKKCNTNFILDGASGNDDISEYLISQNPSAENQNGVVYSANNQPVER